MSNKEVSLPRVRVLELNPHTPLYSVVFSRLRSWVDTYGTYRSISEGSPVQFTEERRAYHWSQVVTPEDADAFSDYLAQLGKHAVEVAARITEDGVTIFSSDAPLQVEAAGMTSQWTRAVLSELYSLDPESYIKSLEPVAHQVFDENGDLRFSMNDERYSQTYWSDTSRPITIRAYWQAKSMAFQTYIATRASAVTSSSEPGMFVMSARVAREIQWFDDNISAIEKAINAPVDMANVEIYRQRLLEQIVQEQATPEAQANSLARFVERLESVKKRKADNLKLPAGYSLGATISQEVIDATAKEFATIPLAPSMTPASRTWGIEVETVRANETSRPAGGWRQEYDGSLDCNDGDGEYDCDCNCDNCCDYGEHCEGRHCNYNEGGGSAAEFVSPILSSFNSRGLRQLCEDLGDDETNTTPGIHIHVGADGLSAVDVGRLLFAYSAISPLLAPLYHREVRNYCKDVPAQAVIQWTRASRSLHKQLGSMPNAMNVLREVRVDRYLDVNVLALSEHGTIEFRAMGPYYNYEHLVRWAWFLREMMNVSRLNLPQSVWTGCKSLTDVITILKENGKELAVSGVTGEDI